MFKDKTKVKFIAGRGGNGQVSFGLNYRPMGGNAGNGGDVYLIGDAKLYDFKYIKNDYVFSAENGEHGGNNGITGADGKDLVFKVPLTTNVYDLNNNLIFTIETDGEKKLLAKGSRGGLGNQHFRKGGFLTLRKHTNGLAGEELEIIIELELLSDIIFIGLPNAGKSSILKSLTNADAKIASYAFTTIDPQLGRMDGLTLMDLPGLIEGTFEGKGLGTKFAKHTRKARLAAHFVSLENEDLFEAYNTIRKELKNIDEDLYNKPELVILTKHDVFDDPKKLDAKVKEFKKKLGKGKEVIVTSVIDDESLEKLKEKFKLMLTPQNL